MRTSTLFIAVGLASAAWLGAAKPFAVAETGSAVAVYTYTDEDGVVATWIIRTACTPDCTAQVTTGPGQGFAAPLIDGRHSVTRIVPDGVTCPPYRLGDNGAVFDGGRHPVTVHQWWDPLTLTGEVDFLESPSPCGIPDSHDTFTLTLIG